MSQENLDPNFDRLEEKIRKNFEEKKEVSDKISAVSSEVSAIKSEVSGIKSDMAKVAKDLTDYKNEYQRKEEDKERIARERHERREDQLISIRNGIIVGFVLLAIPAIINVIGLLAKIK